MKRFRILLLLGAALLAGALISSCSDPFPGPDDGESPNSNNEDKGKPTHRTDRPANVCSIEL